MVDKLITVKTKIGEYLVREDLLYTDTDEWIQIAGDVVTIGITDYAQKKLRHIVNIELPEVDREVRKGEVLATLESVKAIADVYAPLDGVIVEVNEELKYSPDIINKDPYGQGWIVKLKSTGISLKLMRSSDYLEYIRKREGIG
ncbi:MAG: glycine cleavage system protein GcvH [Sulfolobales archaeon]|nr:glycine cleavage system protein GcvH [Sulfolobales archaeon]MDW8082976.1 glycine cleavage system protein GcvH [Sulfolobales archaeon]